MLPITPKRHVIYLAGLTLLGLILMIAQLSTAAQEDSELKLYLNRNFGYSSGTGRIQGNFTAKISGPENLTRVVFLIDGEIMGEDAEAPYELRFHTSSYPLGLHTISASGNTSNGQELHSNEWRVEFVSADEGLQTAGKIAIPLVVIIALAMLSSFVLPMVLGRGKTSNLPLGAPRNYGFSGGTICPHCQRPFGMHIWGFNLVVGKLDRCPYCGRWSLVRHVSPEMLREAEAAELNDLPKRGPSLGDTAEEALRKDLDDSRYQDY